LLSDPAVGSPLDKRLKFMSIGGLKTTHVRGRFDGIVQLERGYSLPGRAAVVSGKRPEGEQAG